MPACLHEAYEPRYELAGWISRLSLFFFFSVHVNALTLRMRMRMQQWELKDAIQYRFEKWRGWTKAHL